MDIIPTFNGIVGTLKTLQRSKDRTVPKENTYWVGGHNDLLNPSIREGLDIIMGCFDLERDVERIDLYGPLMQLMGEPTYVGKDPKDVHIHIQTSGLLKKYAGRLDFPLDGLVLRVELNHKPYQGNDSMRLYP